LSTASISSGIKSVFFGRDFITVTKNNDESWHPLKVMGTSIYSAEKGRGGGGVDDGDNDGDDDDNDGDYDVDDDDEGDDDIYYVSAISTITTTTIIMIRPTSLTSHYHS